MARERDAPQAAVRAPGDLQLLIKPVSGRCNLACGYCFYRRVQEKLYPEADVMSGEVLTEMIRQYLSMGLGGSSFSWQGGEPTLAGLEFFKEAMRLMMKHGRGGQVVANSLQTNGILLDDRWADFLARYRFLVGVSVDGPPDLHNRHRGNSFDRAMKGARTAMKLGVEVNVLACVSREAEGRARETYEFLKEQGFGHVQFIPIVEFVGGDTIRLSSCPPEISPESCRPEGYGDFLIELFEVWKADESRACIRLFDSLIELAGTGRSPFCIFAPRCGSYIVVEASGDLYPCDFFVREELKIGNLFETPIPEARSTEVARAFAKIKTVRPERCRECEWWRICRGGCLKEREAARRVASDHSRALTRPAGSFDAPGYLCEGTRRFLDHAWGHFEALGRRHFPAADAANNGDTTPDTGQCEHARDGARDAAARLRRVPVVGGGASPGARRPGANDPCPCGSGRKFKRCCGRAL